MHCVSYRLGSDVVYTRCHVHKKQPVTEFIHIYIYTCCFACVCVCVGVCTCADVCRYVYMIR